jgi:hypothetical protein
MSGADMSGIDCGSAPPGLEPVDGEEAQPPTASHAITCRATRNADVTDRVLAQCSLETGGMGDSRV